MCAQYTIRFEYNILLEYYVYDLSAAAINNTVQRWYSGAEKSLSRKPKGHTYNRGLQFVAELLLIRFSWFCAYTFARLWLVSKRLERTPTALPSLYRSLLIL